MDPQVRFGIHFQRPQIMIATVHMNSIDATNTNAAPMTRTLKE